MKTPVTQLAKPVSLAETPKRTSPAQRKLLEKLAADSQWLAREYGRGRGTRQLAQELSVSHGFVRKALLKAGIELRKSPRSGGKHTGASRSIMGLHERGPRNPMWRNGLRKHGRYILVHAPGHLGGTNDGYCLRSRLNLEKKIGRFLEPQEIAHHLDGNPRNDAEENLALIKDSAAHTRLHAQLRKQKKASQDTAESAESASAEKEA